MIDAVRPVGRRAVAVAGAVRDHRRPCWPHQPLRRGAPGGWPARWRLAGLLAISVLAGLQAVRRLAGVTCRADPRIRGDERHPGRAGIGLPRVATSPVAASSTARPSPAARSPSAPASTSCSSPAPPTARSARAATALRLRLDLLRRLHRVLLLGQRRVQLLPDQHGDGRMVEGRQLLATAAVPATTWTATPPASATPAAGTGGGFCDPGCDGVDCGCGPGGCDSYVTGCFQFRYGQCNQDVACMGRIVCRVVACVPPWEIDPTCTTTTPRTTAPPSRTRRAGPPAPVPPPPPCNSPLTNCQVVGMAPSRRRRGYAMVTSFGRLLAYGDFDDVGDVSGAHLDQPIVGMAATPGGGLLAGGGRRRHLRLRRRPLLRLDGRPAAQPADGGHGRHPVGRGLLAGGGRRRHLLPSATPRSTARWAASRSTSRSSAWPPPPPAAATGWWPPTAASSPSATPGSTAPWAASRSTSPSSAWPPPPPATATGWWPSDGGIFAFGDAAVLRLDGRSAAQPADRGHGRAARRPRATGWWPPTAASSPSTPPSTGRA